MDAGDISVYARLRWASPGHDKAPAKAYRSGCNDNDPTMSAYWVYILTNAPRSTLYVGVTNDLVRRAYEHRGGLVKGFTQRYKLKMLVYFEQFDTPQAAIQREKNIKHWPRAWKLELVESSNPQWRDLWNDITR